MKVSKRKCIDFHTPYGIAKFMTFNGFIDKHEHFALIFMNAHLREKPLVRVHSECITGDVFNSEHCDCGNQLNEALDIFSKIGGILLYMRQEGRGVGLYNKIDAYALQSVGIDTFAANRMLDLPEDSRDFEPAAAMLKAMGVERIELLSNNPDKSLALEKFGIVVSSMRNTSVFQKEKNMNYLQAKKEISGHQINIKRGTKNEA
ncbi:MAG: GTP cyclohydrolase II RibA [Neisseriaceae bacterium]|nr:MAG: GTP cyclohydrolase II RibA [Neisseriaceae bacterium]